MPDAGKGPERCGNEAKTSDLVRDRHGFINWLDVSRSRPKKCKK